MPRVPAARTDHGARQICAIIGRDFELGMPQRAGGAFDTKSSKIVGTGLQLQMSARAVRSILAETSRKPGAHFLSILCFDMQKGAVFVAANAVRGEEMADGHAIQIILVQKLARIVLLTQSAQPVLANNSPIVTSVSKVAAISFLAPVRQKQFANRLVAATHRESSRSDQLLDGSLHRERNVIYIGIKQHRHRRRAERKTMPGVRFQCGPDDRSTRPRQENSNVPPSK